MPFLPIERLDEEMAANNNITHSAVISEGARIGRGNHFGPGVVIGPNVVIGDNNRFEAHVCVGMPPESRGHLTNYGPVVIGNNNVFREFVTVQGGVNQATRVGNNVLALRGSHISHDTEVEDDVQISCNVLIGGHSHIMVGANLGLGAIVHQHQVIGAYSMLGMGAVVTKHQLVVPGQVYVGNPARHLKANDIGLVRAGVTADDVADYVSRFEQIHSKRGRSVRIKENT